MNCVAIRQDGGLHFQGDLRVARFASEFVQMEVGEGRYDFAADVGLQNRRGQHFGLTGLIQCEHLVDWVPTPLVEIMGTGCAHLLLVDVFLAGTARLAAARGSII